MPPKLEPTVEELASSYVKDRTEAFRGLKRVLAVLMGVVLAANLLAAVMAGITPDIAALSGYIESMDESTSSSWLFAFVLVFIGACVVGHRFGYRIAAKALDASKTVRMRLIYGGLLVIICAGLTPLLPLQATFLGVAASLLVAQFEAKPAAAG